jgi:hypothetical protein
MKVYWPHSQKGKIIQIMLRKGANKFYEDFDVEHYKNIWVGNSSWSRMSELLNDWILDVEYFENPKAISKGTCKRAKYKLKEDCVEFYRELYWIKKHFWE